MCVCVCVVTSYSWAYTFGSQCTLLGDSKGRPWKVTFPFSLLVGRFFLLKRLFSLSPLFSFQSLTRFFYLKRTSFRSLFCPVYLNDDRLRNKKFAICSKPLQLNVYQEISTALKMLTHKFFWVLSFTLNINIGSRPSIIWI